MKRDFLKELGITDEATIKSIMDENAGDVKKARDEMDDIKQQLEAKDTEITGLKEQLTQRDTDIENLKQNATDAAAVQQKLDELQTKYQTDTTALNQKLADQKDEFETTRATEKFFSGVEFSSELAREAAIQRFRAKGFKREGDAFQGGAEWLEQLKKDSPESFKADPPTDPEPPKPQFTRPMGINVGGARGKTEPPHLF